MMIGVDVCQTTRIKLRTLYAVLQGPKLVCVFNMPGRLALLIPLLAFDLVYFIVYSV